jgi:hypothetical protein
LLLVHASINHKDLIVVTQVKPDDSIELACLAGHASSILRERCNTYYKQSSNIDSVVNWPAAREVSTTPTKPIFATFSAKGEIPKIDGSTAWPLNLHSTKVWMARW